MPDKRFGVAVAIAGLVTGLLIAPGEVQDVSYGKTEISGYSGSEPFAAPNRILADDSYASAATQVSDTGARYSSSRPSDNYFTSGTTANIPETIVSKMNYDLPVECYMYLSSAFHQDDYDNKGSLAKANTRTYVPAHVAARAGSSRALALPTRPKSILRPGGCARCAWEVARVSAAQTKSFSAMFSMNFFRKGGSIRQQHLAAGIRGQTEGRLATASTFPRGWRNLSL